MGIRNRQEEGIGKETDPGRKELEVWAIGAEVIPGRGGASYSGSDPRS